MNRSLNRSVGSKAEEVACNFLANKGYKILKRNYFIRGGEIDIIAKDKEFLVFVEVKARYSHEYGLPTESITFRKLKALQRTANLYIHQNHLYNMAARFDLVAIDFSESPEKPLIELIQNITV